MKKLARILWAHIACNCFCLYRMFRYFEPWQVETAKGLHKHVPGDTLVYIGAVRYEVPSEFENPYLNPKSKRKYFYLHPVLRKQMEDHAEKDH